MNVWLSLFQIIEYLNRQQKRMFIEFKSHHMQSVDEMPLWTISLDHAVESFCIEPLFDND